ncbi:MAG: gliding motility-associated C-terminal domain-containing protein, partial [Cyclobacteriaceae bacterium]|nr:gliding motility-associated C-terminal domain-containing protein [Cyclobacteriaceae bacterium]
DFTFTWYESDGTTLLTGVTFVNGTTTNGGLGTSGVTGLASGTYKVAFSNSTTGCPSTVGSQMHEFTIDDISVNPLVNLSATTSDTYCDNTGNTGDGSLTASLMEDGVAGVLANYSIEWYRGSTAQTTAHADFIADNLGSAAGANAGTAVTGADILTLNGLSTGFYTIYAVKNSTPNAGCGITQTFEITNQQVLPTINIPAAQVTHTTICNIPGNGAITIRSTDITMSSGSSNVDDFNWTWTYNDGATVTALAAPAISGTGAASLLTESNLSAGTYSFTATSKITGCASASFDVVVLDHSLDPEIDGVAVIPNINCSSGTLAVGGVEILFIDGNSPTSYTNLTYQWYNGNAATAGQEVSTILGVTDNSYRIQNVPDNIYTVVITNTTTGCVTTQQLEVTNEPKLPIIEFYEVNKDLICGPTAGGAPGSGSFVLSQIRFNGKILSVANDSLTLATDYTLEYYDANGTVIDQYPATPFILDSLAAGTYNVTIRNNASNCTSDPVEFSIQSEPQYPSVLIVQAQADSTCSATATPNGLLVATADNANDLFYNDTTASGSPIYVYTFNWYAYNKTTNTVGNFIMTNDTLSGQPEGTYYVEVFSRTTGCSATGIYTLESIPAEPEILSLSVIPATTCSPGNGLIAVSSLSMGVRTDYSYQFYVGDPFNGGVLIQDGSSDSLKTAEPGVTYFVQATHLAYGCTSTLQEVVMDNSSVTYPDIAMAFDMLGKPISKNNTSCEPARPTGRLAVTANGSTDTTLYQFDWNTGYRGATLDSIPAGTYTVTVTTLATGCSSSESYTLIDDFMIPLTISTSESPNTNCVNPNGKVAASVLNIGDNPEYRGNNYTFYWFIGKVNNPDPANADYTGTTVDSLTNGFYTVYAVDNVVNCFTSDAVFVEVKDHTEPPVLLVDVLSDMTFCYPEKANGLAQITDPDDNLFRYSGLWYAGTLSSITDTTGLVALSDGYYIDSLSAGNYTAFVIDQYTGCSQVIPFEIKDASPFIPSPNIIVLNDRTDCMFPDGHARVNVLGETTGYLFDWYTFDDPATIIHTGPEMRTLDTTTYLVKATHIKSGCESGLSQVTIFDDIRAPLYTIEVKQSLCLRTEDNSTNQFSGEARIAFVQPYGIEQADTSSYVFTEIDSIVWYDADGFVLSYDLKLIDAAPGDYSVWFRTDKHCDFGGTFHIDPSLRIYNGISANDDGLNEFFLIDCLDLYPNNNVKIFSRDGTRVYEMDGYDNLTKRFEGFSNVGRTDRKLPVGTYFYVIDRGDGSDMLQGYLELVR